MKKLLAILLSLAMTATLAACSDSFGSLERVTVSTDYPAALMVDGSVYFKGGETMDLGDIDPDGHTTKIDDYPDQDGECNFGDNLAYVLVDDEVAIQVGNQWFLCSPRISFIEETAIVVAMDYGLMVVGDTVGLSSVHTGDLELPEDLSVGDTVEIRWDGMLQETYPGGMANVYGVNVEEQGNDILGAYRAAFAYLQEADSALDSDIEKIALDLQATSNHLTTAEKEALTYLIACDSGMFDSVYQSTFEDLVESGDIVDDGFASFENGVLYTFAQTDSSADGFTFDMDKFRSSRGAYGVQDCEVVFDNDGNFTLTTGTEWIS
ncbi:MAG: hypothetical protein SNI70_03770 [Rikenellaceae bacterium]